MDALKIAVKILVHIAIVSAIKDYRSEECYDACELTKECTAFERSAKSQRVRCTNFLENRCGDSLIPSSCLDELADYKQRKCPGKILGDAIMCFKCKIECDMSKPESTPAHQNNIMSCINQCEDSKGCNVFKTAGPMRMTHCRRLSERMCGGSNEMIQCLDSLSGLVYPKCPQSFRISALTCMKCKEKCKKQPSEYAGCPEKCKYTKECKKMTNGIKYAKRCEKITARDCAKSLTTIQCLESLKTRSYVGCPKHIRKDSLFCLKCQESCTQAVKKEEEIEQNNSQMCRRSCSGTSTCITYKKATPVQKRKCTSMTQAFCDITDEDDVIACLESLREIDNAKCSKEFRSQIISCMKCEKGCDDLQVYELSTTDSELHDDTCENKCENGHECNTLRSASFEEIVTCTILIEIICAKSNDMPKCIENLHQMDIPDCPVESRKNMVACMTCVADCKDRREGSQVTSPTQMSATSNAATEFTATSARALSTITLTEVSSPSSVQTSPVPTENTVTEERPPPTTALANGTSTEDLKPEKRENNCTEECTPKTSSISPECMECFRQKCEGSKDSTCIKMAIEDTCLHKCFLSKVEEDENRCAECMNAFSNVQ